MSKIKSLNKNCIILCSGGLDSVVTAHYVKNVLKYNKIFIIFFNYGQRSLECERKCALKCSKDIKASFMEIKIDWFQKIANFNYILNKDKRVKKMELKELKDTKNESNKFYVPCRNSIFLIYAISLAEALYIKNKEQNDIFVGFKCEGKESYPDTSIDFLKKLNDLNKSMCSINFKVIAPFIKKDKEDIIKIGNKLGVDFRNTFSCYINGDVKNDLHCGYCLACRLRQEGFYWANLKDHTKYEKIMKDFRTN